MGHRLTLVSREQHCISCSITDRIVREALSEAKKRRPDIEIECIDIPETGPSPVEGVKTERFPALLIDGRQVTAGSVITREGILKLIEETEKRRETG